MATHTVRAGEHVVGIAQLHGFGDHRAVWEHPANAALRQRRPDPNVLLPGDELFIPEKTTRAATCATTATHRFRLVRAPLRLRLALRDFDGRPLGKRTCILRIDGEHREIETARSGLLEVEIPAHAQEGMLSIPDLGLDLPLRIGHLDPVEADSGWRARLVNLGYHAGDDAALRRALEEFQCDHGLAVSGEADAATRARLVQVHGC